MKKTLAVVVVVSGLALMATAGQPGLTEPIQVLPRDAIPTIDDPRFESVTEAESHLADNELMIGLVGEKPSSEPTPRGSSTATRLSMTCSRDGPSPSRGDRSAALASCMPDRLRTGR